MLNKKEQSRTVKIIRIILICIFAVFGIIWVRELVTNIKNERKLEMYSQVEGTVTGYVEEERISSSSSGRKKHRTTRYTVYICTIEYIVDGVPYTMEGREFFDLKEVNAEKTVFYNPENPAESVLQEDVSSTWQGLFWMAFIVLAAGLFFYKMFQLLFGPVKKKK